MLQSIQDRVQFAGAFQGDATSQTHTLASGTADPALAEVAPPPRARHNDLNGDGRSDVLWRHDNGAFFNWFATASGGFTSNSADSVTIFTEWKIAGTGDFNGDGRADVLWRHDDTGEVGDWLSKAGGGFSASNPTVTVGVDWHIVGIGDFNGDHRDDILWEQNGGALINWLGDADGNFTPNSANFSTVVGTEWRVAGTNDYNGDGRSDILWRKDGSGQVMNWLGTASGGFVTNGQSTVNVGTDWHISGTGDFNGDGIGDILWRQNGGLTLDWLGTSSGVFVSNAAKFSTVIGTEWRVEGVGDYNGDGRDDILWRQDGSGTVIDWLASADGGFQTNSGSTTTLNTAWHIQDPFLIFV